MYLTLNRSFKGLMFFKTNTILEWKLTFSTKEEINHTFFYYNYLDKYFILKHL